MTAYLTEICHNLLVRLGLSISSALSGQMHSLAAFQPDGKEKLLLLLADYIVPANKFFTFVYNCRSYVKRYSQVVKFKF